jgi:hypothetical protein
MGRHYGTANANIRVASGQKLAMSHGCGLGALAKILTTIWAASGDQENERD